MFKFIHTSDWHLGQNFYGYDRSEEQSDFLRQLADIVHSHQPDALLVSGDIFHTAAPSNAAVNLYVEGMLNIHDACPTMAIIVIAGNHDSASRLDCDKLLWERSGINVLGSLTRDSEGHAALDPHLIDVSGKGIVAAVPFAYPNSFPSVDNAPIDRELRQQHYFQALLDRALAKNPEQVPVVLMAHLAVQNCVLTDYDQERNHEMEYIDLNVLGTGYDYAALGHIHHPQPVGERGRYCGTPLAVSFDEQCEHSVSIVEIDSHGAMPRIETQAIKNLNPLHTIPAMEPVPLDDALELLQEFNAEERAYIRLNVAVERYLPAGAPERAALAVKDKKCRFCDIKKTATAVSTHSSAQMTVEEFNRKTPEEVAQQFFIDKTGTSMSPVQQDMFNQIYQSVKEENRE